MSIWKNQDFIAKAISFSLTSTLAIFQDYINKILIESLMSLLLYTFIDKE